MIGLLNKIPPNAKHSFVAILGIVLGFMVSRQEHFNIVFESMDGALTYLSIMSSVSFAILAVLMQMFDHSISGTCAKELKKKAIKTNNEMSVEVWRIIFMLLPVVAYSAISFFDVRTPENAGFLVGITFVAFVFSFILPFKYLNFIRNQMVNIVEEKEDEEIKENLDNADELLKQIDCMSIPKDESETDAGEDAKGEEEGKES
ncbi:hypothetical protein SAMN05720470_11733 [Fibrobacter sp. UWOV1]|uniref:hypothetical protein n=1 Tax=Fibrobacter sp. UWOV1 TaxID=1896215 RepID=UPI000923683C|nr:hypothetical protein [Fibrobacter sp. UWOV1]SHL80771.1 hypothetical protein SAMN05720470_11733 [Fibrobacter sp. UWOV1]